LSRHTLVHQIADWAARKPQEPALFDSGADGQVVTTTWAEYWQEVREVGQGLVGLGLEAGQSVAIIGANRKEWLLSQFATMAAGGVPAPIYVTNTVEQVAYIIRHAEARIVSCDSAASVGKVRQAVEQGLCEVDWIIAWDETAVDGATTVLPISEVARRGRDAGGDALDQRLSALDPQGTAMLIYTSGTTGVPKGAELTHAGMVAMGRMVEVDYPRFFAQLQGAMVVSYLPLCHVAEQMLTNLWTLALGGRVWFCADMKALKDALGAARPHFFLAVPRVWEKFQAILGTRFGEATGMKAAMLKWARGVELAAVKKEMETGRPVGGLLRTLANRLVLRKVRAALGLDRIVVAISGAAPIGVDTLDFFASLGVLIYEGFGMTETTGAVISQPEGKPRFGTVGVPITDCELRLAADDEIQLRGPTMTPRYRDMPDETAALYTDDGWLCTGDLGAVDADGYVRITGRKKDILITAGGKNVAPAELEAYLESIVGVANAVVVGDRQPYLCALLSLEPEGLPELARVVGIDEAALDEMAADKRVHTWLQQQIETCCNGRVARYQTIKKFRVVDTAFSVDTGELTPTMKVRRPIVNEKYADRIAEMYAA